MIERPVRWIRSGPSGADGQDGTLGWLLGMMLWWRVWAFAGMLVGGLAVAGATQEYLGPGWFWPYIVGLVVGGWIIRVSPKYSVTKNY